MSILVTGRSGYLLDGPLDAAPSGAGDPGLIRDALATVFQGVELGAYDQRVLGWLGEMPAATFRAVVSLMWRCRAASARAAEVSRVHVACQAARRSDCPYCGAEARTPCVQRDGGPDGYHLARLARARKFGRLSWHDLFAVLDAAQAYTPGTVIYDLPAIPPETEPVVMVAPSPGYRAHWLNAADRATLADRGRHCGTRGCHQPVSIRVTYAYTRQGHPSTAVRFLCDGHGGEFAARHQIPVGGPPAQSSLRIGDRRQRRSADGTR